MGVLTAVLLAAAVLAGVPLLLVGIGALTALSPLLAVAALAVVAGGDRVRRRRRVEEVGEAAMLRMLGAELNSGASVRQAIAAVAERHQAPGLDRAARLALAGVPMGDVAARLAEAIPGNGRLLSAAIALGARTGSGLTALVQRLAERADRETEMQRELRAATVQARLSTFVVGFAPLLFTGFLVATGAVPAPWRSSGALAVIAACGVSLEVAGFVVVLVLLRRHSR